MAPIFLKWKKSGIILTLRRIGIYSSFCHPVKLSNLGRRALIRGTKNPMVTLLELQAGSFSSVKNIKKSLLRVCKKAPRH